MKLIKAKLNKCPLCGHVANVWQGWDSKFQAEYRVLEVRERHKIYPLTYL